MNEKMSKASRMLDDTIRKACERISQKKRKPVVFGLCFLFVAVFSFMLWDSFTNQVRKVPDIKHIKSLDLPKDSLIHKLKDVIHGQKQ
ncbi:MAG: hypothetical protein A2W90_19305 [Bacteroidetes bacterium GWF2_42_66]|nr:MAG: hypothetical protein A2W92_18175 [Bacteroidetes bacterium GWA2_42_15]OFX98685.1 MAG: hypothetical protein A2W89_10390 [Bacteroidetes bacterium GWE2_42_39]OFY43117.1 MAG: hypothetical protein A2W90_19305 [Bacteroidetes bacterium GWF2_42_66]HBL77036.1 hypothetical protein [Prolixibacteraceae bacterium]HCR90129.1 hypothetical protein [Prolixibacteraceae bacterium]